MKFTYLQSSWNHYYYDYVALSSLPFRYFFHLRRRLSEKFVHTLSPLLVENIPLVAMLDRVDLWTWRLQSSTSFTTSSTILFPSFLRRAACYAFKKKKKNTNPLACIIRQILSIFLPPFLSLRIQENTKRFRIWFVILSLSYLQVV